jgi:flavin reductase (DIM6/NTAB) family NADH-FMN oxidoreductase RutF
VSKVNIEGAGRYSCHYPVQAVIITVQAEGKDNAMAVAWHAPISSNPPLYGIAITPKRLTYDLILESKEFAINFVPFDLADLVASVGGITGRQINKFEQFDIATEKPTKISAPLLRDSYASYECRLADHRTYGDHEWVVGEIVATHFSQEVFSTEGQIDLTRVKPTLYIGAERYASTQAGGIRYLDRREYGKRRKD